MSPIGYAQQLYMKRRHRSAPEGGQAMVEFAFTVPIIVLLFLAVIGFAWLLYFFVTINSCAREGARYVIGHPQATVSEVEAYVKGNAGVLNQSFMTVTVDPAAPANRIRGSQMTVRVDYPFQIMNVTVPYVIAPGSLTLFPPMNLFAESTMNLD